MTDIETKARTFHCWFDEWNDEGSATEIQALSPRYAAESFAAGVAWESVYDWFGGKHNPDDVDVYVRAPDGTVSVFHIEVRSEPVFTAYERPTEGQS